MKKRHSEIEKEVIKEMQERRYQTDDEGRAVILMNVKNDDDFLSEFSESSTPVISSEVAEFIENSTSAIPPNQDLTLRIQSDCIDDGEKEIYRNAVKEYYLQRYIANEGEIKRNFWISLLLGIAGIIVLAAEIIFDYTVGNLIWTEVIDIVAWVLIWEATDIALLETRGLRMKKKRILSYIDMKIEYKSAGK